MTQRTQFSEMILDSWLKVVFNNFNFNINAEFLKQDDSNDSDEEKEEKYVLKDLEITNGYTINHREEDGYINVTNLCKAGKKKFNDWHRLDKTKTFLQVLSNAAGIPAAFLIKMETGYGSNQGTWVHPQVAINIAQWI